MSSLASAVEGEIEVESDDATGHTAHPVSRWRENRPRRMAVEHMHLHFLRVFGCSVRVYLEIWSHSNSVRSPAKPCFNFNFFN